MAWVLAKRQRCGRRQRDQGDDQCEQEDRERQPGSLRQRYAIEAIIVSILAVYGHVSPSVHSGQRPRCSHVGKHESSGVPRQHRQVPLVLEQPRIHPARQLPRVWRDNTRNQDALPGNLGDASNNARIAAEIPMPGRLA